MRLAGRGCDGMQQAVRDIICFIAANIYIVNITECHSLPDGAGAGREG